MSCDWMDGCEIDFPDNVAGLWTSIARSTSTLQWVSTVARTGSGSVRVSATSATGFVHLTQTIASTTDEYVQVGFYWASSQALIAHASGNNIVPMIVLASSTGVYQVTIGIDVTSNVLKAFTGGATGTLRGTGSTGVSSDAMHVVEVHAIIHGTTGSIGVRLDGNSEINVTGIDTDGGGADIQSILIGMPRIAVGVGASGAAIFYYDDIIFNNTSGTVANSWPNGAGIEKLVPNADGNYTAWTSTGGAVDYTEIDDVATYGNLPDDDTTTILSSTTGQRTSVNLTNTTLAGLVEAVMLLTYAKNSAAGADQMAQGVRLSSADYDSTAFAPATTYGWHTDILTLNPRTADRWLTSEINGMEQMWNRVT